MTDKSQSVGRYFDAVVLERRELTERIVELRIGALDGSALQSTEPGSHVELQFGGSSGRFLRQYSLVGPVNLGGQREPFWRVAVQRENRNRGSAHIHSYFRVGTRIRASQPIATFRLAQRHTHVLLIAGGIGITPILPMVRSLVIRQQSFTALYLGTSRDTMAYADEVATMAGDNVRIHETHRDGRINLGELLAFQPPGTAAYVCGPSSLIEAVQGCASEHSWDLKRVRFEVFNAAHRFDDVNFVVRLKTGQAISVKAGTTALDAMEALKIDTLSDCRRGECGLCVTDVINAYEGVDHRDNYLTPDEKRMNTQMAICCSRAIGPVIELALS